MVVVHKNSDQGFELQRNDEFTSLNNFHIAKLPSPLRHKISASFKVTQPRNTFDCTDADCDITDSNFSTILKATY
uniref:Uncharacterized protein n=1 Tax=Romanomermis culicivorax TaxID=13658 RepID=A0A915IMJ9_ROMCU